MKRLISHIKEGRFYHAVEVTQTDAEAGLFFISIQKKKNALDVTEKSDALNIKSLSGKLKKNTPLFVVIHTEQVLTKVVPLSSGDDPAVVNSAFPNIRTEDFYYECTACGNKAIVSVCRKAHADAVLQKFGEAGIKVAGFSLGVSKIGMIKDFIPADAIALPGARIILKNKEIETIEKNESRQPETYDINGITLESSYLLGFAAVLSSVLKNAPGRSNFEAVNAGFLNDLHNARFFGFFLKAGLGALLAVLLINFLVFNYYYRETETLRQTLTVKSADKQQVAELNRSVGEKQKRVEAILMSSSSKSSLYIDKIAAALPSSVLLDKMIYQPVEGQIKQDQEIEVKRGVMIISGASKDSNAFSAWVESLEKQDWIERISIRDYDYSGASVSSFTIQITLKNEK